MKKRFIAPTALALAVAAGVGGGPCLPLRLLPRAAP